MTRERLQSISVEKLSEMARSEGLEIGETLDKGVLIDFLVENHEELRREHDAENNAAVRVEEAKYGVGEPEAEEGPVPEPPAVAGRCTKTKVVMMVRDPHWAFAYWRIEEQRLSRLAAATEAPALLLRVHETAQAAAFDIPVQVSDSSWYIYLPNDNSEYWLELGQSSGGRFHRLASSNRARTPRESFEGQEPEDSGQQILGLLSALDVLQSPSSGETIPQRILSSLKD